MTPPGDLVPCSPTGTPPSPLMVEEWYFQLAALLLENPHFTTYELAAKLGRTARWIATIKNSDTFCEYLKSKKQEAATGIRRKTETLVELTLDRLIDRVELSGDGMKTDELNEIVDKGSKRLGYGSEASRQQVNVQVGVAVGRGDLELARKRMQDHFGVRVEQPAPSSVAPPLHNSDIPLREHEVVDLEVVEK